MIMPAAGGRGGAGPPAGRAVACRATCWSAPRRPGSCGNVRAHRRAGRRPPRACTWPGWRSTTTPTATSTPSSARARPIPSGRVSPGFALGLAGALTAGARRCSAVAADGPRALAVDGAAGRRRLGLRPRAEVDAGRRAAAMSACRGLDVMMGSGAHGAAARAARRRRRRRAHRASSPRSRARRSPAATRRCPKRALAATVGVAAAGALLSRRAPAVRRVAALGLVGAYAAVVGRAHADAIQRPVARAPAEGRRRGHPGPDPAGGRPARRRRVARPGRGRRRAVAARPPGREAEGGHVSLRFGYVSNGLSDHRLEDALELLAENGYAGVALTLDHIHFDPLAPRLRARAARAARGARGARALLRGGDRRALRAGPAPQALPDAGLRRPPAARRPAVHARSTSPSSSARRSSRCGRASRPRASRRERAWDLLVDGCERVLAHAERQRRHARVRARAGDAGRDAGRLRAAAGAARAPAGARADARHRPHRLPRADVGDRVRPPRRADARARPHRGHAPRRARAPDVRRRRAGPRRGARRC